MKDGKRPAEGEMSSWERWNLSKRLKTGRARPNAAKKELPEKKPEAPPPPPLALYFLEDPERTAYYKLDLTYKASFPLQKLRLPLLPLEDDPAKGHSLCIHGLQEVETMPYIEDGYRVVEQRVRKPKFGHHSPVVYYYKELMSKYWPCLGKKFKTDEKYYAYQDSKHNLDRYPKERFLLNGVLLGGGYIDLIEGILKKHKYLAGPTSQDAHLSFVPNGDESVNVFTEVASFPCSLLQEGSSVEVFVVDGDQHIWVAGVLNQLDGEKALVMLPETDGKGKQHKWVEIGPQYSSNGSHPMDTVTGQENHFPFIRPSVKVDNFPENIFLGNYGVEKVIKVGQPVEAWSHDRWFQGTYMGFNECGVKVELCGDAKLVTLDVASVRFAPIWVNELKSWQVTIVKVNMKGHNSPKPFKAPFKAPDDKPESRSLQIVCMPKSKTRSTKKVPETHSVALISADKYASRNSMLASVVVAWSPLLQTSEYRLASPDNSCDCCSILAVGGKSGMISFWKVKKPQNYSILNSTYPTDVQLVGILHAHMSWVTTMSWSVSVSDASNHQLLLATGSSDGSVKIWHCYSAELLKPSKTSSASFSLFHEVISVEAVPVTVLSLTVPMPSAKKILLAVGKGSGALEVWMCDISTRKFHKIGSDDVHGHVVTGVAWAFDGTCLYSCNQDDSVHCWTLHGDSLCKISLPSNTPGVESSTDVPNAFDSCFGLAVSPGNLVVAVARRFDAGLLDPMYQLRSQKAAVEFFWTGGQQQDKLLNQCSDFDVEAFSGFSNQELVNWEYNIMWSLDQHEHLNKPVVIWDVVAALLAFKQFAPKYVDYMLDKWLRSYVGTNSGDSPLQTAVSKCLSNITTRRLHLLNIIIRCVILADLKPDKVNEENQSSVHGPAKGQIALWLKLLKSSEMELRERLVYCSFSIIINLVSQSSANLCKFGYWQPAGLAQMENWVNSNDAHVRNSLKVLKAEVRKIKKRGGRSGVQF